MFACLVDDEKRLAWEMDRREAKEADLRCPECLGEVVFRKCTVCRDHFAHTKRSNCTHGSGESAEHMECKVSIYEDLQDYYTEPGTVLELEYKPPGSGPRGKRADIYLKPKHGPAFVVEIQKSNITVETINERTQYWNDLGLAVWWIIPLKLFSASDRYLRMNAWKKHLSLLQRTKMNGLWFYHYDTTSSDKYLFLDIERESKSEYEIKLIHSFYPDELFYIYNEGLGVTTTSRFSYGWNNEYEIPGGLNLIVPDYDWGGC